MDKCKKIVILGGDKRFFNLAQHLKMHYKVEFFEFPTLEVASNSVKGCDCLILPLPCTCAGSTMLNNSNNVDLKNIFKVVNKNAIVLAGKVYENLYNLAEHHKIRLIDYYTDEFEMLNAVPSAEGAIKIAMEHTDFTLSSSKCLILGFGRIGKILSKMLCGIGADVTVAARNPEALALIKALGMNCLNIYDLNSSLKESDIIFNTVPSLILDKKNLLNVKKDGLIIDLASKPGGCDFESADKLNLKFIHALGLPGKIAPKTSSDIIINCICSLIEERRTNGT